MLEKIQEISQKFFELLAIQIDSLTITCQDETRGIYLIDLKTQDSNLVIGTHGQNLDTMKHLLLRMIEKTLKKDVILHIEVNDYLQEKDQKLFRFIDSKIDYVMRSNGRVALPQLTSFERKKVHTHVAEKNIEGLATQSEGEGRERCMYLSYTKKGAKLSIDLDGASI